MLIYAQRFTWHAADVWITRPIDRSNPDLQNTFRHFQARLKPGITLEEAEAQLNVIAARRVAHHPQDYPEKFHIKVVNIIDFVVGDFRGVLYTLLAAVALLLLIACCNVANMLLARATVREREMTVRAALGASRVRIIRQLLVESLLLSLAGGASGCLLAYAGIKALLYLIPQNPLPGEVEIALNGPVLLFSLGAAVLSALLFGMAPALHNARRDLVHGLKDAGKGVIGGFRRGRLRNTLVVAQIALSLVLLLSAGLLMRSFISLVSVDLGFNPENILVVPLAFAPGEYTTAAEKHRFYQQALQRIASLPGVQAAAATTSPPPFGGYTSELEIPGKPSTDQWTTIVKLCTGDFFRTLDLRFVRGRGLSEADVEGARRVAVVNQTLVENYFGAEDPVGKYIRLTRLEKASDPVQNALFEIVGVVEDVKNQGIRGMPGPEVYLPGTITGLGNRLILVRTSVDPVNSVNAIRHEIRAIDRQVALTRTSSLEDILQRDFYSQPRFSLIVLGVFACTGMLVVAIGVYSVMAYTVSRQTQEIAVRMALGADRGYVLLVVLRLGAQLIALGVGVGILASFATSRLIATQLWNTPPHDALTLASAVSVIAMVGLAACYVPALRATRVNPMAVLRHE